MRRASPRARRDAGTRRWCTSTAIALDADFAQAYAVRADARRALGNPGAPPMDATRSIELDPAIARVYVVRSDLLLLADDHAGVIRNATQALALEPSRLPQPGTGGGIMAEYDLTGRVVIVTGGGRGLGRAMVLALVEAGASVVAAAHIEEDFAALRAHCEPLPGRLACAVADIRQPAHCDRTVQAAIEAFGRVDALVNNAGLTPTYIWPDAYRRPEWIERGAFPRFYEAPDGVVQAVMDTNFVGADQLARRVAPQLVAQGWGRIVNVTTMYETMTRAGASPYGPSKAALECASEIWHKDLAGTGVTVNILNPGAGAATPGMAAEMREENRAAASPFLVEPEQMQAPIVWLLSAAADGVSGMRFDAKPWDPNRPAAEEAGRIGWPLGVRLHPKPDF